ncbi:MAG TPA: S8 family serine peptidase [Armatimonadota bacterium]
MHYRGLVGIGLVVIAAQSVAISRSGAVSQPIPPQHVARIDENVLRIVRATAGVPPPFLDDSLALVQHDSRRGLFVTVYSTDVPASIRALASPDVTIAYADSRYGFVEAWVPARIVEPLAARPETRRIDPVIAPQVAACAALPGQGAVSGEADCILRARDARDVSGLDGSGVSVGVISDGVDGMATSIATGDLPADTRVIDSGPADRREGRAMMEIVHDMAPGAHLAFSSGYPSAGKLLASAQALVAEGCDIIVDDVGVPSEPFFEDGPVAKAVGDIVAGGVTYLTSAGNSAMTHYAGDYLDGGGVTLNPGGAPPDRVTLLHAHTFSTDGAGAAVNSLPVLVQARQSATVVLQWADPWLNAADDYDLYVVGQSDGVHTTVRRSTNIQNGAGCNATEWVKAPNDTDAARWFFVVVNKKTGMARSLRIIINGSASLQSSVAQGSVYGHACVPSVITVGAISANAPPYLTAEPFSSQGPADIRFPVAILRPKPDVCGMDGVTTSVTGFSPFYGTSAAAPSVAAVAALMKQQLPAMTPAQVQAALAATAIDAAPPGTDPVTGAGRVDALNAVLYAQSSPSVTPDSITFQGTEGGAFPAPVLITLHGTFATSAVSTPWTAFADVPWLHIVKPSGVLHATDTFVVWADTTGIVSPGASGHVLIGFQNARPPILQVNVQLNLAPPANAYVVTSTKHDTAHPDWVTLTDAVTYANSHPGTVIRFNIPISDPNFSGGVAHLQDAGYLALSGGYTVIDGNSETVFVHDTNPAGPEIQTSAPLWITSANNAVRGLAICNVPPSTDPNYVNPAVMIEGAAAAHNTVSGCYIGLDATGTTAAPNDNGIYIANGAAYNVIGGSTTAERNVISANGDDIYLLIGAHDNIIAGNWIGLDGTGTRAAPRAPTQASHRGLLLWDAHTGSGSSNNVIGGSKPGEGNVISGHDWDGIGIMAATSTGNRVIGNRIGTDSTGTIAIPNAILGVGIWSSASNNDIGGAAPGEANVISGNGTAGVRIWSAGATGNRVLGNLVGVAADGLTALPNGMAPSSLIGGAATAGGVVLDQGCHDNFVGGLQSESGKRNVVAGNAVCGLHIKAGATHNFVLGNSIGCADAAGMVSAPNHGPGVFIDGTSLRNVVGGLDPFNGTYLSGGNQIAFNTGAGVAMARDSSLTNTVSRNGIHDNGGLGIDLGNDGRPATPVDGFYNAPILSTAYRYDGFTLVSGTFDPGTEAAALEFFTSPTADPSGYGEGKRFLLSIMVASAGAFTFDLPGFDAGTVVTAVAVRRQNGVLTDTSEFSNAVAVQDPPPASDHPPVVTLSQPNGGEVLAGGSTYPILWTVEYLGGLQPQHIEYSLDSGASWADAALEVDPAARAYTWEVPRVQTGQGRVRVTSTDWEGRIGSATSAADLTINTLLPWTIGDAATALRIAGGIVSASLNDSARLDVVTAGPSAGRIDLQDAVGIARKATGLDQ